MIELEYLKYKCSCTRRGDPVEKIIVIFFDLMFLHTQG